MSLEIPYVEYNTPEPQGSLQDLTASLLSKAGATLDDGTRVVADANHFCSQYGVTLSPGDRMNCILSPALIPQGSKYRDELMEAFTKIMAYDRITESGKGRELLDNPDVKTNGEVSVVTAMMNEHEWLKQGYMYAITNKLITPEEYMDIACDSNGGYILAEAVGASKDAARLYDAVVRRWADVCKIKHDYSDSELKGNYCIIKALQENPNPSFEDVQAQISGVCREINDMLDILNGRINAGEINDKDMVMYEILRQSIEVADIFKQF